MPAHYRRLTAHLQTGSADFNRKLAAYLCTNVAMRTAVEQAISNSYQQNAAGMLPGSSHGLPFAPNPMYPSPMFPLQHQQQRAQMMQQQQQQQLQNPLSYRQAPYTPRPLLQHQQQQMMQQNMNQMSQMTQGVQQQDTKQEMKEDDEANQEQSGIRHRPLPISTNSGLSPRSLRSPAHPSGHDRRQSVPTAATGAMSPVDTHEPMSATAATPKQRPSFPPGSFSQVNVTRTQHTELESRSTSVNTNFPSCGAPLQAQPEMLLNSATNPFGNDPLLNNWSGMMAGAYDVSIHGDMYNNIYNFGPALGTGVGKHQIQPTFDGLNSTLAPAASDPSNSTDFTQSFLDRPVEDESPERNPDEAQENNSWADNFFDYDNWTANAPSASQ